MSQLPNPFAASVFPREEYFYRDKDRLLAPKLDRGEKFGTYGMIVIEVTWYYPILPGRLYHPIDNGEEASFWLDFYQNSSIPQKADVKRAFFVPAPDQYESGTFIIEGTLTTRYFCCEPGVSWSPYDLDISNDYYPKYVIKDGFYPEMDWGKTQETRCGASDVYAGNSDINAGRTIYQAIFIVYRKKSQFESAKLEWDDILIEPNVSGWGISFENIHVLYNGAKIIFNYTSLENQDITFEPESLISSDKIDQSEKWYDYIYDADAYTTFPTVVNSTDFYYT